MGRVHKQITTAANCSGSACRGRDPDDDLRGDASGGLGAGNESDTNIGDGDEMGPTVIRVSNHTLVLVIMPEGSKSTLQRPNWAIRLGNGFGIAGFLFDIGEMATIFDVLPGDEDAAALADVGITYLSSAFGGDSYIFERSDPSLPYMVTVNQDVIFTAGDAGGAGLVKIVGGATTGPIGYLVGEGTDVLTTGASIVYDSSRVFGNLNNYVSVGISITSTDQINSGDVVVLLWPK
ncbi:MAG TPA: hypothetical protein V6D19_03295 [Stenomitos sp.]